MRSREKEYKNDDTKIAIDLFEYGGRYETILVIIVVLIHGIRGVARHFCRGGRGVVLLGSSITFRGCEIL